MRTVLIFICAELKLYGCLLNCWFSLPKHTNVASVQELFSCILECAKACRGESVKGGQSFCVLQKLNPFSEICLSLNIFSGQPFRIRLNIKDLKKIL